MYKKIVLFFFLIVLNPLLISAEDCNSTELSKLKAYANSTEIKYFHVDDYTPTEEDMNFGTVDIYNLFYISINNLLNNFYVVLDDTGMILSYDKSLNVPNVAKSGYLVGGREYKLSFYAHANDSCNAKPLLTKTITLPSFNYYSLDPLCKGLEDYKLCNIWYAGDITRDEFVSKITNYKEGLKEDNINKDFSPKNTWDIFMDWLIQNYNTLLISIIIFGSIIIIIIKAKEKRGSIL